jgi:hypothetical protein
MPPELAVCGWLLPLPPEFLKLQASEYSFTWSHKYSWYWLKLQVAFFPLTLSLISARNFISYYWHLQCFMLNGVSLVRTCRNLSCITCLID